MLKKRLVAVLPILNNILVQSVGFKTYLPIGRAEITVEYLNKWGIDEIIILDISARKNNSPINFQLLRKLSSKCLVPLSVGGGITTMTDVENLMHCGADKIIFNNPLLANPALVENVAKAYGNQCVIASIDIIKSGDKYFLYDYLSANTIKVPLEEHLRNVVALGAGEIMINCVDRDGMYIGYDIEFFKSVCSKIDLPVLACGGAKNAYSILELFFNTDVAAACVGNYFNFYEHSVNITKAILRKSISQVRLDTHACYYDNFMDTEGRLLKKDDADLESLLYLKIEKETI